MVLSARPTHSDETSAPADPEADAHLLSGNEDVSSAPHPPGGSTTQGAPYAYGELSDGEGVNTTLVPKDGMLKMCLRKYYVPLLLHRVTKVAVLLFFAVLLAVHISYASHDLKLGLDQAEALPSDSYLQDYFQALANVLRVGPPVYWVVRGDRNANLTSIADQNRVCSGQNCSLNSLSSQVLYQVSYPIDSYLAADAGVSGWLDDYFLWVSATTGTCCRVYANGTYCPMAEPGT